MRPRDRRPPCVPGRGHAPPGPRRRVGRSPPDVRGPAPSGALPGDVRRDVVPTPPPRPPRAPPSSRRGLPAPRPREGVLPPTDGRPPPAGRARPRGGLLGGTTRRPRRGVPPDRVRGPRHRGGPSRRRRTGVRGERPGRRPGERLAPGPAGLEARLAPGGDADVPREVRRCPRGPRTDRGVRDSGGTAPSPHPARADREPTGLVRGRAVDPRGSGPGGLDPLGPGGRRR